MEDQAAVAAARQEVEGYARAYALRGEEAKPELDWALERLHEARYPDDNDPED